MITENLSTLKIHKLTQEQYDREREAGNLDANALYLTPDEETEKIQSDWAQTDDTKADYIKNKPENIMTYNEVDTLPETANEGDVYAVKKETKKIYQDVLSSSEGFEVATDYILCRAYNKTEVEQVICEAIELAGGYPANIVIIWGNTEITFKVNSYTVYDSVPDGGPYEAYFYGSLIEGQVMYIEGGRREPITIGYIGMENKPYIYCNGEFVEFIPDLSNFATEEYVDTKVGEIIPSDVKNVRSFTTSGSGSSYTATISNYTAYTKGDIFIMIPHTTATTTSPTLNINSLGAKTIGRLSYSSGTKVSLRSTTELSASYPVTLVYNGTYFIAIDNKQPYGGNDFYSTISVSKGGTGKTSWNSNGLVYASSSSSLAQISSPTETSILTKDSSGAPYWTKKTEFGDMSFIGAVEELPSTALKGQVYKTQECTIPAWGEEIYVSNSDSIYISDTMLDMTGSSTGGENVINAVTSLIPNPSYDSPVQLKLRDAVTGNIYYFAVTSYQRYFHDGAQIWYGQIYGELIRGELYSQITGDVYLSIQNGISNISAGTYIYHNNSWVGLIDNIGGGNAGLESETSSIKKIGFTTDCDYVATSTDGRTAFAQAIQDANDGDTILVMAGEYLGSSQLDITKDLNFIAFGPVLIKFNVWTQGGGTFSFENWEWENVYDSKHSKWLGFTFDGNFLVGVGADPDNVYYNGFTTAKNCRFNGGMNTLVGNFENCVFQSTGFEVGHYYGADKSTFNNCIFKVTSFVDNVGNTTYNKCELYYINEINVTTWVENDGFIDCKFYAPGSTISVSDSHSGSPLHLNNSLVYANGLIQPWEETGIIGGFLVSCAPLGSGSTGGDSTANYVTRTEMENYVNEQILGGEW